MRIAGYGVVKNGVGGAGRGQVIAQGSPRFSVVIPLHNKGPHVARALDSALAQTYPPHEIIVVDDASSDGGLQIVESYSDSRIRVLRRSVPGPGGYAARNCGIRAASGDWIAFLDADDDWSEGHLQQLRSTIEAAGDGVGCVFTARRVTPGDRVFPTPRQKRMLGGRLDLEQILAAWVLNGACPLWTGAVAVRASVFERIGLFIDEGVTRGGDKHMWLRVVSSTQSCFAPEPTARFHKDTVNRVSNKARHTELPVILQPIRALEAETPPEIRKLLRVLRTQELAWYARYALGKREPVPAYFLKHGNLLSVDGLKLLLLLLAGHLQAAGTKKEAPA